MKECCDNPKWNEWAAHDHWPEHCRCENCDAIMYRQDPLQNIGVIGDTGHPGEPGEPGIPEGCLAVDECEILSRGKDMGKEISPRYEVRDGMVYDRVFETTMQPDIVVDMLNKLYEQHGTPVYECDDEEDEIPVTHDIGDPNTHQNWRGRPC